MEKKLIRIGSRGSRLALWQAHYLQDLLKEKGFESEITIIKTKGDAIQHLSFDKIEGKGFFTKEIEDQLLAGEVDIAVHSMKDLPTTSPTGLKLAATSYRENPTDTLLIHPDFYSPTHDLKVKPGTVIGTSSARRKAQLKHLNPNISTEDIRGNVPTRIEKLREGQFGAIVLATAGLTRLQLDVSDLQVVEMHPREFVPAPAQGVLAYQTRDDDFEMIKIAQSIGEKAVAKRTNVERKVLQMLDGGCHLPLGVYCETDEMGNYHAFAAFAKSVDSEVVSFQISQSTPVGMAEKIYENLQSQLNK